MKKRIVLILVSVVIPVVLILRAVRRDYRREKFLYPWGR